MLSPRNARRFAQIAWVLVIAAATGCGATLPRTGGYGSSAEATHLPTKIKTPALITFDSQTESLVYWTIAKGGSTSSPSPISGSLGVAQTTQLAADGNVIVMANYSPPELVTYDVMTHKEATLTDPYGGPLDVAVDTKGNFYAMHLTSITIFKAHSHRTSELSCSSINNSQAIAVDNEGDVFINGYGPNGFMGVVEYPEGSASCEKLKLQPESGYVAGLGIDPNNDELIVMDDPDLCAGGTEGRIRIYPKPYRRDDAKTRILGATYCASELRLDAGARHIFYEDATVSAGIPIFDESSFPSGKSVGQYWEGYFGSGDYFSGITTIPNSLPN